MTNPVDGSAAEEMPQPQPKHAITALQNELARLRQENARISDNNIYLGAMYAEGQEMIGSLLAQLSQQTPNPDAPVDTPAEGNAEG